MLSYYSRPEIKEQIAKSAKDKEIGVIYSDKGFGKRPDMIQYESDVQELANQGVSSFHITEESWKNPLELKQGMTRRQLDDLRKGWDLVIDIDSPNIEHSKIIAKFIIEALRFHDVQSIFCKFSGNKGFHIAIPFEAFPEKINDKETRLLFPEGPKAIMNYISDMIKKYALDEMPDKEIKELELDAVLISSRHMFRAPYSLHEKSGLASIPIDPDKIMEFEKSHADISKIKTDMIFLDREKIEYPDAEQLIVQAFDWQSKRDKIKELRDEMTETTTSTKNYEEIKDIIPEKFFPESIKKGLEGLEDGKKRFLFILLNFLKCVNWPVEDIAKRVKEWNQKNPEPLKEGYIISQLNWHKRQKEKIPPPNYDNAAYYKDLRIAVEPEHIMKKFKNPVNYTNFRYRTAKN